MRDVEETEVRERLHAFAGAVHVPPTLERPTIRRARRRRAMNAAATTLLVVALLAGSYAGIRSVLGEPTNTIGDEPTPAPAPVFEGLWPETDLESLQAAQRAADDGHQPLRTDAAGTASMFATNLMNWPPESVVVTGTEIQAETTIVELRNEAFGETVPSLRVVLRQLGVTGPGGVWSVVGVSTPLIELDAVPSHAGPTSPLVVSGRVTDLFEGSSLTVHVLDGPTFESAIAQTRLQLVQERFELDLAVPPTPDGRATVLVWVPDALGMSLGTIALPIETPIGGEPTPGDVTPSTNLSGVPPVVAATAKRIHDAALARDFDALAGLLDPNTFVYNFDDGSDPIPAWREDPSILDTIAAVLELRPVAIDVEEVGRFYVWPYLMHMDLTDPTAAQLRDLERIGIGPDDLQAMLDGFGGYVGPRLSIDATGLWRNFVVGGD